MGVLNMVYCPSSAKLAILFLTVTVAFCSPPYHHGHGHRRRHQQDQNRCQETQNVGEQSPPTQNEDLLNKGGSTLTELSPGTGTIQKGSEVKGGGIMIFSPNETTAIKGTVPGKATESCPEGSGIHKPSGKCYRFSRHFEETQDSPCGLFMEFYKDKDPLYGDCDCKEQVGSVVRPIVYWGLTDRCYWQFDQGPCKPDEWLVMDENDVPSCFKRSCPENLPEDWNTNPIDTGKKKFWFRHLGKCYQTETQAYCENPTQKVYYETDKKTGYVLRCKGFGINVKALLNGVKELPCSPGHKKSISGDCSRVATFE